MLIVHEGTNDLPNNLNPLDNLRKVSRSEMLELSPETKLVFSAIIIRKDKTNLNIENM